MSAVAGVWRRRLDRAPTELLARTAKMISASRRGGPAESIAWGDSPAGFAMAWRGVTQTASPGQPITSSCGRFVLACDGRIYNAAELIGDLRGQRRAAAQSVELGPLSRAPPVGALRGQSNGSRERSGARSGIANNGVFTSFATATARSLSIGPIRAAGFCLPPN